MKTPSFQPNTFSKIFVENWWWKLNSIFQKRFLGKWKQFSTTKRTLSHSEHYSFVFFFFSTFPFNMHPYLLRFVCFGFLEASFSNLLSYRTFHKVRVLTEASTLLFYLIILFLWPHLSVGYTGFVLFCLVWFTCIHASGTPAMTSRGCLESDFVMMADFLFRAAQITRSMQREHGKMAKAFMKGLENNKEILDLRTQVENFATQFAMPGQDV